MSLERLLYRMFPDRMAVVLFTTACVCFAGALAIHFLC